MKYENALNFLLYSYFEIDDGVKTIQNEKNKENITKLFAQRAYLDLARTVKYKYTSSDIDKMTAKKASQEDKDEAEAFQTAKKELINNVCTIIINEIKEINNNEFDSWHQNICNYITSEINNKYDQIIIKPFTYGQAQKWVNMTLKYLWLLDMLPEGLYEESLHVPIDSYILQKLKGKVNGVTGSGETYYYNNKTWSTLDDYSEYMKLQKEIKEIAMTPIAWEAPAWIEVAEKRKNSRK